MDKTIRNKIKQFIFSKIVNNHEETTLTDTESLIDTGIIDSLAIMKLLSYLEEEFAIEVTNNDLLPENFESIESLSHLVSSKIKN